LIKALKGGSFKNVGFKPTKLGNFNGVQDQKVVDVWFSKMEDYLHAAKVRQHSTVELVQSYLKGYISTWWKMVREKERKSPNYTWEFFKECIELEYISKNSDCISRCKLRGLLTTTNDNLHQYVKAYTKFMLEVQHIHELKRVCHFVMGLLIWG
jgi:hypothetical protein